jgi:DNA-binding Lrp family transcriptional regulator
LRDVRDVAMPIAFVLINSEVGGEDQVLKELKKIKNVREAHIIYGAYDIIVKIEAESLDALRDIVTKRIRRLDKVRSTLTSIVVKS